MQFLLRSSNIMTMNKSWEKLKKCNRFIFLKVNFPLKSQCQKRHLHWRFKLRETAHLPLEVSSPPPLAAALSSEPWTPYRPSSVASEHCKCSLTVTVQCVPTSKWIYCWRERSSEKESKEASCVYLELSSVSNCQRQTMYWLPVAHTCCFLGSFHSQEKKRESYRMSCFTTEIQETMYLSISIYTIDRYREVGSN